MYFSLPLSLLLLAIRVSAQAETSQIVLTGSQIPSSIPFAGGDLLPTGPQVSYKTYNTTSTLTSGSLSGATEFLATTIAVANGSTLSSPSSGSRSTSSISVTILQGGALTASATNSPTNVTSTSTSGQATNTQPCNNYPEFCARSYSNITYVAAHNSPFISPNNAAANQLYGVTEQLNDGIRMLQGQTHFVDNTMYYCHTSCDILNAGSAESYFKNITRWIETHYFDVVTLLIGNADFRPVTDFIAPLESSGLSKFAYVPSKVPMNGTDWPALKDMILLSKRVVIFMDYNADQTKVPYILDQFSQVWETPFSPTDRSFPCTVQRPPDLSDEDAGRRMYMANHNLNTEITAFGTSLLVPTTTLLNETNAVNGTGSLGAMANDCAGNFSYPVIFVYRSDDVTFSQVASSTKFLARGLLQQRKLPWLGFRGCS